MMFQRQCYLYVKSNSIEIDIVSKKYTFHCISLSNDIDMDSVTKKMLHMTLFKQWHKYRCNLHDLSGELVINAG